MVRVDARKLRVTARTDDADSHFGGEWGDVHELSLSAVELQGAFQAGPSGETCGMGGDSGIHSPSISVF